MATITTFKSFFDNKKIEFTANIGINLICGLNGSGKSSILSSVENEITNVYNLSNVDMWNFFKNLDIQENDISVILILEALNCILHNPTYNYKKIIDFKIYNYNDILLIFEDNMYKCKFSYGELQLIQYIILFSYAFKQGLNNNYSIAVSDDFCNNFDSIVSKSLCEWLLKKSTLFPNTQLFIATNNRFVINSFPLNNLMVVENHQKKFKVYNYANSKTNYEEFAYTGMGNFDFITSFFYRDGYEITG